MQILASCVHCRTVLVACDNWPVPLSMSEFAAGWVGCSPNGCNSVFRLREWVSQAYWAATVALPRKEGAVSDMVHWKMTAFSEEW